MVKRFTVSRIDAARSKARASSRQVDIATNLAPGLVLRSNTDGSQNWTLRVRFQKKQVRLNLGLYPAVSPEDARTLAISLINEARANRDPSNLLRPPPAEPTTGEAWEVYSAARTELRSFKIEQRRFQLHVEPTIGRLLLKDAMRAEVLVPMFDRLVHCPAKRSPSNRGGLAKGTKGGLTSEANRVYSSVRAFAKWARQRRMIPENPFEADGIERPVKLEPSQIRHQEELTRVLSLNELTALWLALDAEPSRTVRDLTRLLMLVPLRRSELGHLAWSEYDPYGAEEGHTGPLIRIPASRMKGKRPAIVPLPNEAAAILDGRRDTTGMSPLVFPGRTNDRPFNGWRKAALRVNAALLRCQPNSDAFVLHDIRRSIATALVRDIGADELLVGRILQHSTRNALGVTAIYQQSKRIAQQAAILQSWADLLTSRVAAASLAREAAE